MTEYIGWIGTFLGFFSFALLALGKIKNTHWFFSGCILVSSIIFFYTSYLIQNYQSIFTNLFFIVSSFLALIGITLKARWLSKPILYGTCLFVFLLSSSYYIILNTNDWFMQSIGWVPVFSFPFIFFLYTQHKITEFNYYLLNMSSNILFSVHLFYMNNYPFLALQILAFSFALMGLFKLYKIKNI